MKKLLIAAAVSALFATACTNPAPPPAQTDMTAQNDTAAQSQIERNKAVVLGFYEMAFNQHKLQEAVDTYIGSEYIQHNPTVPDGTQAFIDTFTPYVKANPESRNHVKQVVAEGDLVVLHSLGQRNPQDRGTALVDIFRVDSNGKIVEHWDVIQPVPDKTASGNGMF